MFEFLKQDDWAALSAANGGATFVPESIVRLYSSDEDVSRKAYFALELGVVPGGALSEAAVHLVPVLVECLKCYKFNGYVSGLLFQIGNGEFYGRPDQSNMCRLQVVSGMRSVLDELGQKECLLREVLERDLAELEAIWS